MIASYPRESQGALVLDWKTQLDRTLIADSKGHRFRLIEIECGITLRLISMASSRHDPCAKKKALMVPLAPLEADADTNLLILWFAESLAEVNYVQTEITILTHPMHRNNV